MIPTPARNLAGIYHAAHEYVNAFNRNLLGGRNVPVKTPESHDNLLILSGPVTLYESSAARDLLLGAVAEATSLEIDLKATGPWDLAGLQLLVSAVASGKKAEVPVHLIHVPRVCQEVAERSGLSDWLKTVSDSSQ